MLISCIILIFFSSKDKSYKFFVVQQSLMLCQKILKLINIKISWD